MNPDNITASHRSRLAYVYIRQSTQHQVHYHLESQRRQRSLVERAVELGWTCDRVTAVDEDLGQSAARGQDRAGFQKMVAEAALGNVGLILALEVSRLSRGNRDWYHLLDICAVTGTLLGDGEGLYDPRSYNDRLLLGLKGTMSEAELHIMKQRLVEAMRAKAKRGEFRFRLPPGYEWDEQGRLQKTPDEQVRSAIEQIFSRFEQLGTIHQVQCSLGEDGFVVPVLSGRAHRVRWAAPNYEHMRRVLTNPMYAGAYCYGRRQVEEILDASQRPVKRKKHRPRKEWHVLIRDHHEPYIGWESFEKIQRQIELNRRGQPSPGAPREGCSLLQGLILCGYCGRRMKVAYSNRGDQFRYRCVDRREQTGLAICQSFGGRRLERAAERLVLETLEPLGIEAMIEAAADHARVCEAERGHWRQRVERARYEVDLARRYYDAVDPANRLVGRELERRFEKALGEFEEVESQAEARIAALEKPLTLEEQEMLRSYARDLSQLWNRVTTRPQDRKRIVRCLIENVVVTVPRDESNLKAEIHWTGGEVTKIEVLRGRRGIHRYVADPELVELVRELATEFSDEQIARILHRKRLRTAKGLPFSAHRVTNLRYTHEIPGTASRRLNGENVYTAEQAASLLEVSRDTIIRWIEAGLVRGSQVTSGAPWRVQVTEEDKRRLTAADTPKGWLPLKGAATALDVSQQTVLQRLKSGQLEGIRVRVGRRSAWRIRITASGYDKQLSLLQSTSATFLMR